MKKNKKVKVFLNKKQRAFSAAPQPTKLWMGGRGSGKNACMGKIKLDELWAMPRAKVFIAAPTYTQLLTKSIPPIEKMWSLHGYREHIPKIGQRGHYVIGKRPPANWERPYDVPRKYANIITFWNGFTIDLISTDRPDLARGGSFDGGDLDEAQNTKYEFIDEVILPSLRGNAMRFSHVLHQQLRMYCTVPTKAKGSWIYNFEEKAMADPSEVYWQESTTLDNIDILGEKAIKRMQRDMTPIKWEVECMNKRFVKPSDGFYHKFDDGYHVYTPKYIYGEGDRGITVEGTADVVKTLPIDMSLDFGGYFKGMTLWQEHMGNVHCFDAMHVGVDKGIDKLINQFADKYRNHKNKHINLYGEYNAKAKDAYGAGLFDAVSKKLLKSGWTSELCVIQSQADRHEVRYDLINEFFAENYPQLPKIKINGDTCDDVVVALNYTRVKPDYKKDKSDEKNHSFNQAHATHYTDTIDYYLLQKYGHLIYYHSAISGRPGAAGIS